MRVKWCLLGSWAAAACLASGCAQDAAPTTIPVTARQAEALAPEDLGIGKYVFEARVPAGRVMVLRCTTERDGQTTGEVLESIQYTDGGAAREVVLVYDASRFPFCDGKAAAVRIRAQSGGSEFPNRWCSSKSIRPGRLVLELTNDERQTYRLTYDCFVEDYAAAKKRIPRLPEMTPAGAWTHNATLKAK